MQSNMLKISSKTDKKSPLDCGDFFISATLHHFPPIIYIISKKFFQFFLKKLLQF